MDGKQVYLFDLPRLSLDNVLSLSDSEKKTTFLVVTTSQGDFKLSLYDLQQFVLTIGNFSLSVNQGLGSLSSTKIK